MKKISLIVLFVGSLFCTNAQESPEEYIDIFLTLISEGKYKQAFEGVRLSGKLKQDTLQIPKLISKFKRSKIKNGNYCGYELISKDEISPSFVVYSFLIKYTDSPERISITFYKPIDIWQINDIRLNPTPKRQAFNRQKLSR